MTKKKAKIPTVVVEPNVEAAVQIDKNDVIAIGVAEAETFMQNEMERCRSEAKFHNDRRLALTEQMQEEINKLAERKYAQPRDALAKTLAILGIKEPKFNVTASLACRNKDEDTVHYTATLCCSGPGVGITSTSRERAPRSVVKLINDAAEQAEESRKLTDEALEWKRRLAAIPQYERQQRAKLAKACLAGSQRGREVLAALCGDVKKEVLALPGR